VRVEVCASDDYDTRDMLFAALAEVGARSDGEPAGAGLHRFAHADGELSVFVDAWVVDVAGPDHLVRQVLQLISAGERS
jgi:hypothetical protein